MDSKEVLLLKKALERQKKARAQAEKILEEKSKELYDVTHHLKESNARLENLLSEKTSKWSWTIPLLKKMENFRIGFIPKGF